MRIILTLNILMYLFLFVIWGTIDWRNENIKLIFLALALGNIITGLIYEGYIIKP